MTGAAPADEPGEAAVPGAVEPVAAEPVAAEAVAVEAGAVEAVAADAVAADAVAGDVTAGRMHVLLGRSTERLNAEKAKFAERLERNKDRPLIDVALRLYQRDRESAGTVVGSAIAFRLFLFFVPLLLFMVGLLGFLSSYTDAEDVNEATGVVGTVADQISTAFEQPNSTRWLATLVGLVGMATTGRSLSKVMVSASALTWRLPVATRASVRVVGGIVGLVTGIGLVSVVITRIRAELGVGVAGVSYLAAFVAYLVGWVLVSALLPRPASDPSVLLPGAVLVAASIVGMQAVSQLYLPGRMSRASELYGAIGTTIVTLGWFFILGRVIVLSLALDAVMHERFGTITRFVFSLPIIRLLPRWSKRVRRFFELDA